ncbi:WD40-repeat-containing domain protein [Scleroderma yunnanense]
MSNNQSKTRLFKKPWRTKPNQATTDPQFTLSSPALSAPEITATSREPNNMAQGKRARLKNLLPFNRSNQNIASSSMGPHSDQNELDATAVVPPAVQHAVKFVDGTNTQIDILSSTYVGPLKTFNTVVGTIANINPYTQMALGLLTSAAQLVITQTNLDSSMSSLLAKVRSVYEFLLEEDTRTNLETMKDILARIAQVISNSAQFIKNYSEIKSFWKRLGKNVMSETQTIVDAYNKELDELMQQCRDHAVRDNAHRDLENLNLDDMAYASDAGLKTTKKCLDGTRMEVLNEIVDWAGRGKSAIAHTIALWSKNVGGLGSCFCFARHRQTERREEKMLSTIARDLANRDLPFRRALAKAIEEDNSLKTTTDIMQQWEKLLLEPLKVSGGIFRTIVLVIDALDESGGNSSRKHILKMLTSADAASLPSNFRVLVTSRPLSDITLALGGFTGLRGIGEAEINQIVRRADGLFEWARLACEFVTSGPLGQTTTERFDDLVAQASGEGTTLLDSMYMAILDNLMDKVGPTALTRFHSVMRQVLYTLESLPMDGLNAMRRHFSHRHDDYEVAIVLDFMGALLSGVTDHTNPVRPLHASFYDYLTDQSRNGAYFVNQSDIQTDLAMASLGVLRDGLCFNICRLESSYLLNSEVLDLPERVKAKILPHLSYSCRFWAKHLQSTKFDTVLAGYVMDILGNKKILFWFETLSLLGVLGNAVPALSNAGRWLQGREGYEDAAVLAKDGVKFIHNLSSAPSASTPHLYISALTFSPENSVLWRALGAKFPWIAKVAKGHHKDWPATQVLLQGHIGYVTSVAFSPDGTKIVSGSGDSTVRIWDADRGVQIGSLLEGHIHYVTSAAFSPDGTRIVSGSDGSTVRIWDADRGVQIGSPLEGHTGYVRSVAFSPDGTRIVSGSNDRTMRIWDVDRVAFSPDGTKIVSGSDDSTIGSPLEGHTDYVRSVAFSPDGTKIVSGSDDSTVRIWDADRGVQIGSLLEGHTDYVTSVAFSPNGTRIVSGSNDSTVRIWDADRDVKIGSPLEGHTHYVRSVAFSSDETKIVSGSGDSTVRIWDADRGVQIGSLLEGHTDYVRSVAFSPDGTKIVPGSDDRTVRIWDADRGVQIGSPLEGHTDYVKSVAFSPDGTKIVSGSDDRTVRIWDADRGVQIGSPLELHTRYITSVAFSPDGTRIVSGSNDRTIRIWDVDRGVQIGSPLEGHTGYVRSVAFSPDGTRIVSGSSDSTVRIWDADRGVQIGSPLEGHTSYTTSVAFSPDGTQIVSGSSGRTVRIWDVGRGVRIRQAIEGNGFIRSNEEYTSSRNGEPNIHFSDTVLFNLI